MRGAAGEQVFGPYLRIARDGRVTVAVPQAETGQGAWTGLAQIAADELGAAWDMVAVEPAPLAPGYANKLIGETRLTAQSSSIRAFEAPLREAAAMARAMLCAAAAARWGVDAGACQARGGFVDEWRQADWRSASWPTSGGARPPIRSRRCGAACWRGSSLPRLDLPAKSDGSLRFAGDVRLPGMRFASVRMAPPGGRVTGFDRAAAEAQARGSWRTSAGSRRWRRRRGRRAARSMPPRRAFPGRPRPTRRRSSRR